MVPRTSAVDRLRAADAPAGLDVDIVADILGDALDGYGDPRRWAEIIVAALSAPTTTNPRLIEPKLVVPASAGLDDDALLDAIDSVYISSSDTGHLTTSEAMAIASAVRAALATAPAPAGLDPYRDSVEHERQSMAGMHAFDTACYFCLLDYYEEAEDAKKGGSGG